MASRESSEIGAGAGRPRRGVVSATTGWLPAAGSSCAGRNSPLIRALRCARSRVYSVPQIRELLTCPDPAEYDLSFDVCGCVFIPLGAGMSTEVERGRGLEGEGIETDRVRWNLPVGALYEEAVRRHEGLIAAEGPLSCRTGHHTGRSPNDKFIVCEPSSEANIAWGAVNRPMSPEHFDALHRDIVASLKGKELFVLDCFAGADPAYRLPVRVINEYAWHNLFCRNLFINDAAAAESSDPAFTIIDAPNFKADPRRHGTRSDVVIALNFAKRLVLIGGTSYAGEMKKSIFSVLNYLLPLQGVLSMHCSANIGETGDVALFFGLSGTGKTTLSSDPHRMLIGDDEHGWSERGVFNFEGGCYAKTIRLSAEAEPQIYSTTR